MRRSRQFLLAGAILALITGISFAQFGGGGWGRGRIENVGPIVTTEGGDSVDERTVRTARETASHSTGTPEWTNAPGFDRDVFTFTRIIYKFAANSRSTKDGAPPISRTASPWGWITDYPDSDLNLSFRVQQMTTIRTDPDGRELHLMDPALLDYPWIYMVEVGRLDLRPEEVPILQKYLQNGGVLMVDDFWGKKQWDNFEYQMGRVLPGMHWIELPMTHPIFHCVFDIKVEKNQLQIPNSTQGANSLVPGSRFYGMTWERHDDYYDQPDGTRDMHVRAWLDEKGRIMVIATHNCDNGDGWEREGENDGFFHEFSEKRAYPLGINILYYVMTH
jgi:hypothetical protein